MKLLIVMLASVIVWGCSNPAAPTPAPVCVDSVVHDSTVVRTPSGVKIVELPTTHVQHVCN